MEEFWTKAVCGAQCAAPAQSRQQGETGHCNSGKTSQGEAFSGRRSHAFRRKSDRQT